VNLTMARNFFGLSFGLRSMPVFEAAALPASGDVVVSCDDARADERISSAKARAIYNAVKRHDAIVASEAAAAADAACAFPSITKTGEQIGEHAGTSVQIEANPA
jgi:hypothetical protein